MMIGGDKDTGDVSNTPGGQEKFAMSNWLLQFEHRHYFFNDINNSTPFFQNRYENSYQLKQNQYYHKSKCYLA